MSTLKQIEANRRNALKSTGPVTPEGKQRSRCNALRHGLTAETIITEFEDADDYEAFQSTVIADYDAESAVERELVLRLASVLWRLRRATGIETGLFDFVTEAMHKQTPLSASFRSTDHSECSRPLFPMPSGPDGAAGSELNADSKNDISDCFLRLAALPTYALDRLSRYEYLLWRQARQIVFTLESLRRRRQRSSRSNFPFSLRRHGPGGFSEDFK